MPNVLHYMLPKLMHYLKNGTWNEHILLQWYCVSDLHSCVTQITSAPAHTHIDRHTHTLTHRDTHTQTPTTQYQIFQIATAMISWGAIFYVLCYISHRLHWKWVLYMSSEERGFFLQYICEIYVNWKIHPDNISAIYAVSNTCLMRTYLLFFYPWTTAFL